MARRLFFCCAAFCAAPAIAFGECGPRPVLLCDLVNSDDEIFVGRILPSEGAPLDWRMRVLHSYRGSAKGTIVVQVGSHYDSGLASLDIGKDYLFYASKIVEDGTVKRTTGIACANWGALESVSREELLFLAQLNRGGNDGRVFGTVSAGSWAERDETTPLPGVRISLKRRAYTRETVTDADGKFAFDGLAAGTYTISTSPLPDTLDLEQDDAIEIVRHGCSQADLFAVYKSSLSGRITLPRGYRSGGNSIVALKERGKFAGSAVADADGRFIIKRLTPGEYVVAITGAPFITTYAPGTTNLEEATRIRITGGETVTDINIAVPATSEIVKFEVTATFEDGRPVQDSRIDVVTSGGDTRASERTNFQGRALLSVGRGEPLTVRGAPVDGQCAAPIGIGPETVPRSVGAGLFAVSLPGPLAIGQACEESPLASHDARLAFPPPPTCLTCPTALRGPKRTALHLPAPTDLPHRLTRPT